MAQVFNLPELGEGITEGTIISILFKEGEVVQEGNTVVEIETDKAVLGVPIDTSGTIIKWHIKEGDNLKIGAKLCSLDPTSSAPQTEKSTVTEKASTPLPEPIQETLSTPAKNSTETAVDFSGLGEGESATVISLAVQVGDKVDQGDTLLELETDKAVVPFPAPVKGVVKKIFVQEGQEVKENDQGFLLSGSPETPSPEPISPEPPTASETPPPTQPVPTKTDYGVGANDTLPDFSQVHAGPATRKLARELGVNLNQVSGSGRNNRIRIEDVKAFTKSVISGSSPLGSSSKKLPDFNQWGNIRREKTSKLRDTIAQSISYSWQVIPHVHQHDHIAIDAITTLQKKWKQSFEKKGSILSVTPFIVKAMAECLRDFPSFNTSYDPTSKEIIFKEYFHIGVAVDTPQGLIVPVIKDVNKLSIFEIGVILKDIAAQTRERTIKPENLKGACMTLSNLGGIGGAHFNPIVNWPETAILGVGRGLIQPIYDQEKNDFQPRMILPACLGYDHRVIDGADGARFMVQLKQYLENPDLLLMGMK